MIVNITEELRLNIDGSRNITIERRAVVRAGRRTKSENIGKERWDFVAHCGRLDHAIDALINKHFRLDLEDKERELSEFVSDVKAYMNRVNEALSEKIPEIKKDDRLRPTDDNETTARNDVPRAGTEVKQADTQESKPTVDVTEPAKKSSKWARRLRKNKH